MLGQTLIEKILSESLERRVHAGEVVVAPVDRVLLQDGTAARVFQRIDELAPETMELAPRTVLYFDHAVPPPNAEIATHHKRLLERCRETGIRTSRSGEGISHQCMVEDHASPGQVIVGADSHTCTAGALGALALGMGSTDIAIAIALGETWIAVPRSILVELKGTLAPGVVAKDLMLQLIGQLGASGGDYTSLEFGGEGLVDLSMDERFVLANLAAEVGAKSGLLPSDSTVRTYLASRGREDRFKPIEPDPDASYQRHLKLNLSNQEPFMARPGRHDDTTAVGELVGTKVDQVVIGSCTNGRVSDFEAAAEILRGRRVASDVDLIVAPASRSVTEVLRRSGALEDLVQSGAIVVPPGCGPCVGIHQGVLGAEQVCVTTQSRNFPGRMGDPTAKIYLASPLTAAATALRGVVTDPREFVDGA